MTSRADLTGFELGSMVRLVSALRERAVLAPSLQVWAQGVSDLLHGTFVDAEGRPQTALVRVYVTSPLAALPAREQQFVAARRPDALPGTTACLALLGTAGTEAPWNDRTASQGHLVLPLPDASQVAQLPMIAALLAQLGIDVAALAAGEPEVMLKSGDGSCRIFYVPEATGSELIPGQEFVAEHGITSTIGFGGALPTGEVFAVILFSKVAVPLDSAELFETVALSMKLAALDLLDVPLFEGHQVRRSGPGLLDAERRLIARAELSRALLLAHEQASEKEADKTQVALAEARYNADRASALAAVAYRLNGVRDVSEVTDILIADGLPVLGGDGLSLALRDESGSHVDVTVSRGFGPRAAETYARLPLDDALPTSFTSRTGDVVLIGDILAGGHDFPALHAVAVDVQIAALVSLPLWVGDRLIGALTCTWNTSQDFSARAVESMHALAALAAQAIDRRLLQLERQHSTALQSSLLTPPPQPDHCHIVARYLPAAEIAQVGGDWHDSFLQRDGSTVLVIGDVVGHDTAAAAAMGQVRGLLRGIAWYGGQAPAAVLTGVDEAMEGLLLHTQASVVVARLEQTQEEIAQGVTRVRWSNGHPPPMVIAPNGSVVALAATAPDLILGVDPATPRTESVLVVERGSTLVLYTDGLVERRGEDLDEGLARLQQVLQRIGHLPLPALCDALFDQMREGADDDIAVLAVRLYRQDLPRPAEAGPPVVPPQA